MNIRDEELLQRYFERQMSTGEEQNFLIDVAARDDMRMAFRSQLELLKAVRRDKDVLRGATFVRERTLTALGFASAALPTFLAEEEAEAAPIATATSSGWRALLHKPMVMLTGGLLVGSIATIGVVNMQSADIQPTQVVSTPAAAPVEQPMEIIITAPAEQAPVQNIVSEPAVEAGKTESVARTSATDVTTTTNAPSTSVASEQNLPLVNRSEPINVTVKKPTIKKPGDSK